MRLKLLVGLLLLSSVGFTQDRRWTAQVAGGFTPLLGDLNNYLHNGWNVSGGAGYNFGPVFSATADFMYSGLAVSPRVLADSGLTGGSAHLWSLTVNPRLSLKYVGSARPYVVAGIGYYRLDIHANQSSAFVNPVFGDRGGIGGNAGLGMDFAIGDTGMKIFTDVRYHYAATGDRRVRMIPIQVGLRW
jgi:opacity protein-like surface antigen